MKGVGERGIKGKNELTTKSSLVSIVQFPTVDFWELGGYHDHIPLMI